MGDWADDKAREWLKQRVRFEVKVGSPGFQRDLGALLLEVEGDALARGASDGHDLGKEDTLVEVRRVVGEVLAAQQHRLLLSSILSRLEKL